MIDIKLSIRVILSFLIVIFVFFIFYSVYLKNNPPLVVAVSGSSFEKRVLLVEVGNKSSLARISFDEVLVNNNNEPTKVMIQLSNSLKGFIISGNFEGEEESKYDFRPLKSIELQTNTDPQKQIEKVNKGTATEDDKIYAITSRISSLLDSMMNEKSQSLLFLTR
ncbi:hypothetical protein KZ483_21020 [Paenibacillus sp. sptzw28]|uniref:hypothetical protein n=1 Tax=Paenibacillus sp. sptzw28 TaxID=715179 RepID=UPI001C6EA217|nr:hypothetical protein [Paenibacillus sp. sptzw28]QYR20286.1 hypothetical protein KZ483_21020 [Paenibacillus sp. sptzw28]